MDQMEEPASWSAQDRSKQIVRVRMNDPTTVSGRNSVEELRRRAAAAPGCEADDEEIRARAANFGNWKAALRAATWRSGCKRNES